MDVEKNIGNAFTVVRKTYENLKKLLDCVRETAESCGYAVAPVSTPGFLRWKSDVASDGWLIGDFILLFQPKDSAPCLRAESWKQAPVYALEIDLETEVPCIYLHRAEYETEKWTSSAVSPSDHWQIYWLGREGKEITIEERNGVVYSKPCNPRVKEKFWHLIGAKRVKGTFADITKDNIKEKIFDVFDRLNTL